MNALGLFPALPTHWLSGIHIAKVTSVKDPKSLARVQVQLLAPDPDGEALIWARVAVPFAGNHYGAFLIPGVEEEVLVMFPAGRAGDPIVVGALWNGKASVPESLPGDAVDPDNRLVPMRAYLVRMLARREEVTRLIVR